MIRHDMVRPEDLHQPGKRRVFIDALNAAYWCGNPPSLRVPITLMTHLLVDGCQALMYFDASARYRLGDEAGLYEQLMKYPECFIEVPSGKAADGLILRHATSSGACILSRDKYRDYRKRYRKLIDDPTRLMSGWVESDRLLVSSLALDIPLPASVQEAWEQLKSVLALDAANAAPRAASRLAPAR